MNANAQRVIFGVNFAGGFANNYEKLSQSRDLLRLISCLEGLVILSRSGKAKR